MPTADQLEWYYPLKTLSADGQDSPLLACAPGSGVDALANAALNQADGFWTGAIGRFETDTPTPELRGIYFHVRDFVSAEGKLLIAQPLPVEPATAGTLDAFRLFLGGNYRSNVQIPGLKATGLLNVTGVNIVNAATLSGEGDGVFTYDQSAQSLSWQAPGDANPGPVVVVATDGTYTLYSESLNKWLKITAVAAELPTGSQADTITLTAQARQVLPDWEGHETSGPGKTRYHLVVIKNAGTGAMLNTRAYVAADIPGTPSTLVDTIGTAACMAKIASAADWPVRSFWAFNATKNDLRYVKYRSGNTLYVTDAGAGLRGKTAMPWTPGDAVSVYPEIDIGLDAPLAGRFENPANEETAPTGVAFAAPIAYASGLPIGTLATNGLNGIWIRETVLAGHHPREDFSNLLFVEWS